MARNGIMAAYGGGGNCGRISQRDSKAKGGVISGISGGNKIMA
jgi:hypothetical protein